MKLYNRARLNEVEKAQVKYARNRNGEKIDPNSKQILQAGKIDLGHKYGYEEAVMQKCAKRCGLSQKEYSTMMRNPKLYQWEDRSQNRSHNNECKNYRVQIHKSMQVIRSYKNSGNGKNLKSARERNLGRNISEIKGYTTKSFSVKGHSALLSGNGKTGGKSSGGIASVGKVGGGKGASGGFGGGKGASGSSGGKGGSVGSGGKGK